jgi:hypothetical protein
MRLPTLQHPQRFNKEESWRHHKILRPTSDYLWTHLQEPEFLLFWFTSDAVLRETRFNQQDSYVIFFVDVYVQRWYRKQTTYRVSGGVTQRVPPASHQADSILTRCQEQKPQELSRTSWPQDKGLERSAPTHTRHTHCTSMHLGIRANQSMMFFGTDFVTHAIWQGSSRSPLRRFL